jgi:hypothetical protein
MPVKGSQRFAVLLSKFEDSDDVEPQAPDFFRELLAGRGTGGLNDYWRDASLGAIDLNGTEVFGWKTLGDKRADYLADRPDRASKIQGAVEAHGIDRAKYAGVIALFNVSPGDAGPQAGCWAALTTTTSPFSPTRPAMSWALITPTTSPGARLTPGPRPASTTSSTTL